MTPETATHPAGTAPEPAARRLRLDDQLCFALCGATNAVVRAYRPLLQALGLTHPQYLVLMALWETDHLTVTDLAARLALPAHGLSPVLARLEKAGLLNRHREDADRRVVTIDLTGAGHDLEQRAAQAQHQVVYNSRLTPEALNQLRRTLHLLAAQLVSTPA